MRTGRPLEFDPDAALDSAMLTFWAQGYDGTSMSDLMSSMGLSKSSLYAAFGDKAKLFHLSLARYCDMLEASMLDDLSAAPTGRVFIQECLLGVSAQTSKGKGKRMGCLLMNSAAEFGQSRADVSGAVAAGIGRIRAVFENALEKGRKDGSITGPGDDSATAHYLTSSISGLNTMAKAGASGEEIEAIARMIVAGV